MSGPSEGELAILVALQQRGALERGELGRLLGAPAEGEVVEGLAAAGLVDARADRLEITAAGRRRVDDVLEGIERELAPDDPAFVARYRRETPSIPFETNTVWEEAVAVNFRVRPDALRRVVPEPFELDLYDGWGFVSLTASRLKDFGLGVLPAILRANFYQATYRAHVAFTDFRGRRTRGYYFVRSETNSRLLSLAANMLPEFRGHHCSTWPIFFATQGPNLLLSVDSGLDPAGKVVLVLDVANPLAGMPGTSVFPSVALAREYLVDAYDAFAWHADTGEVLILRIDRGDWDIRIVEPVDHYLGYFADGPFPAGSAELDSVFHFRNVPYRWLPLLRERHPRRS